MINFSNIVEWLKYSYSPSFILIVFITGCGSIFVDTSEMKSKGLERERRVAKALGVSVIFFSVFIYIVIKAFS